MGLPPIFNTVLQSLLGLIVGAVITITILWFSGKHLEDTDLERHLLNRIKKAIGRKRIFLTEFVLKKDIKLYNRNTIIYVGYSRNVEDSKFDRRHVYFFDVSGPTLLDRITSRPGGYGLSCGFDLLLPKGAIDREFFIPKEYQFIDLDNNGKDELLLEFTSTFADRLSNSFLVFYEDKSEWHCVKPPNIKESLDKVNEFRDIHIYQEEYEMELNGTIERFVAYENGGFYLFDRFDLEREYNSFIGIPINEGEATLSPHRCIFLMFRFTAHKFVLDENWNHGKPLLSELAKREYSENEISNIIIDGYEKQQIGNVRFYKGPVFGKLRDLDK